VTRPHSPALGMPPFEGGSGCRLRQRDSAHKEAVEIEVDDRRPVEGQDLAYDQSAESYGQKLVTGMTG
jgi:hypothetical protein